MGGGGLLEGKLCCFMDEDKLGPLQSVSGST